MREIKFRAKSSTQWRYWDLYHNERGELVIYEPKTSGQTLEGKTVDGWRIKVDPETVGQFTGLYDANGREIYEGDIVKATLKEPSFVKRFRLQNELVGEMFFDNAWWMKERETVNLIPPWRLRYYDLTVIGNVHDNVHDNPELLERKP